MRPAGIFLSLIAAANGLAAQLPAATAARIDQIAVKALTETGAPSISIAIVQGGKIAFKKAYGKARLDPTVDARAEMRYSIGSVSKQLLTACRAIFPISREPVKLPSASY
jgi:CubicO group peptidase (beta-lactamase class C family)